MTVILLLHPKINSMNIPQVVTVKNLLIHFHVCVFEEKINKKNIFYLVHSFLYGYRH
jgi:hypothetical protein